jgi:hypothetical protein
VDEVSGTCLGKKTCTNAYTDFIKSIMPKLRADNPTLNPNLLMKEASKLWQTSKEREVHMNSKREHADAMCKKSMESGSRRNKRRCSASSCSTAAGCATLEPNIST